MNAFAIAEEHPGNRGFTFLGVASITRTGGGRHVMEDLAVPADSQLLVSQRGPGHRWPWTGGRSSPLIDAVEAPSTVPSPSD